MANRSTMRTFHLPMPSHLHEALRDVAGQEGRPATEIVREALSEWLDRWERARLADEIACYAREVAGTEADLAHDLETAALEHLAEHGAP
jgi:predicted DNA-binding protein